MKVYIYRNACDCHYEWAEIESFLNHDDFRHRYLPVHPGDLQERVRNLIAKDKPFATQSDIVLSMLGWMVRKGEIKLPFSVIYVDANKIEYENPIDTKGEYVMPWREEGFESIQEAGFHYRYG